MTPLSKDIIDALHADGYQVVTRQEWYATQEQTARLETALVEMRGNVEMILEYKLGDFPQPEHYANHVEIYAEKALSSTAGEAAAKRMAALEQVAEAAKEFTSTWGRSKGGLFYRDPEIPGTTIALMEALEEMDT